MLSVAGKAMESVMYALGSFHGTGSFENKITFGGPLSLSPESQYFEFGRHIYNAYSLLVSWVNDVHGGIKVGSHTKQLEIISVDDQSDKSFVDAITHSLIDRNVTGSSIQLLLGPYSSGLTTVAAKIAQTHEALLMAPAAASTSVFRDRPLIFGMLHPAGKYLTSGIDLLHARNIKSITFISEDKSFTKAICKGAVSHAKALGINVTDEIEVSSVSNTTQISAVLRQMKAAPSPDAVVVPCHVDNQLHGLAPCVCL